MSIDINHVFDIVATFVISFGISLAILTAFDYFFVQRMSDAFQARWHKGWEMFGVVSAQPKNMAVGLGICFVFTLPLVLLTGLFYDVVIMHYIFAALAPPIILLSSEVFRMYLGNKYLNS
jgi:hypothetical protein